MVTKLASTGSNPGNLNGFTTDAMKERLDTIKSREVTTSMLPNGIPFPVGPEAPEIMNIIISDLLQNALSGKMTVDEAAEDAAAKVPATLRQAEERLRPPGQHLRCQLCRQSGNEPGAPDPATARR